MLSDFNTPTLNGVVQDQLKGQESKSGGEIISQ